MYIHFLKLAIRNLVRSKKFTILNLFGLGIGLAFSFLIMIYIVNEMTYDHHYPNLDEIYRVIQKTENTGGLEHVFYTPLPTSKILKDEFGDQIFVAGFFGGKDVEISIDEKKYYNFDIYSVENDVFDIFDFTINAGNSAHLLDQPYTAVITKNSAQKLYGKDNPIGEVFQWNDFDFKVTGVIEDQPVNTVLPFDILVSENIRYEYFENWDVRWWHGGLYTYLRFKNNPNPDSFNTQFSLLNDKYLPDYLRNRESYYITTLKGSHITDLIHGDMVPTVSSKYLIILTIITFSILFIACFNYINLTTSQIRRHQKIIGIRRIHGASTERILIQYITEALMVSILSCIVAAILAELLLPSLNQLIDKQLETNIYNRYILLIIFAIAVIIGVTAGSIPVFIFTRQKVTELFKSFKGVSSINHRRMIITSQFMIVIILMISDLIIFKQIYFMKNHELGYNNKNIIAIQVNHLDDESNLQIAKAEQYINAIKPYYSQLQCSKASISEFIPGFYFWNAFGVLPAPESDNETIMVSVAVDENFMDVYGLKLIEGRGFSTDITSDRDAVIINQAAFDKLGWQDINDRALYFKFSPDYKLPVIGIVKNIHIATLQNNIEPLIYRFGAHNNYPGFISIRLNENRKKESIQLLERQWRTLFQDMPFLYFFVEDKYEENYAGEEHLLTIIVLFSLLGIILAGLGIFSLISLITEQRTKEIGVRKVMGATIPNIVTILNKDFLRLTFIAFLLAIPVGYYAMSKWLQNFAYKTSIDWWIFILAGGFTLLITFVTISIQTVKAAMANPTKTLRYE